jgi:hypothetical protein
MYKCKNSYAPVANKWRSAATYLYDLTDLYKAKDPKEVYGFGRSQVEFYKKRLYRYVAALRHLFATGA